MSTYRYMLEHYVKNPELFHVIKGRVCLYDKYTQDFVALTPENDHYVRHCLIDIDSETTRFNDKLNASNERMPICQLPKRLHDARCVATVEEARLTAIHRFSDWYDENESCPDVTGSLQQYNNVSAAKTVQNLDQQKNAKPGDSDN